MYCNDLNQIAKQPTLVASIVAGLSNPATLIPTLAIGISALAVIKVMNRNKTVKSAYSTDEATVIEPLDATAEDYGDAYSDDGERTVDCYKEKTSYREPTISDEDIKKEMIRQTMSELGKRSAAARARRKECE